MNLSSRVNDSDEFCWQERLPRRPLLWRGLKVTSRRVTKLLARDPATPGLDPDLGLQGTSRKRNFSVWPRSRKLSVSQSLFRRRRLSFVSFVLSP